MLGRRGALALPAYLCAVPSRPPLGPRPAARPLPPRRCNLMLKESNDFTAKMKAQEKDLKALSKAAEVRGAGRGGAGRGRRAGPPFLKARVRSRTETKIILACGAGKDRRKGEASFAGLGQLARC